MLLLSAPACDAARTEDIVPILSGDAPTGEDYDLNARAHLAGPHVDVSDTPNLLGRLSH